MATYTIERVVVYWAEAHGGSHTGWCAAVHTVDRDGRRETDSTILPSEISSEREAVAWAGDRFPGAPVEVGSPDIT